MSFMRVLTTYFCKPCPDTWYRKDIFCMFTLFFMFMFFIKYSQKKLFRENELFSYVSSDVTGRFWTLFRIELAILEIKSS